MQEQMPELDLPTELEAADMHVKWTFTTSKSSWSVDLTYRVEQLSEVSGDSNKRWELT